MSRNYINSQPASVFQRGDRFQQFVTYDGILDNVSDSVATRVDAIQKRINFLQPRFYSLKLLSEILKVGPTATLNIPNFEIVGLLTLSNLTNTGRTTARTYTTTPYPNGFYYGMQSAPLYLRAENDVSSMIQAGDAGGVGHPGGGFLELRGQFGGALSDYGTGSRRVCMDFAGGRIRSAYSFKSGRRVTSATTGTVTFDGTFLNTPVVFVQHNITNGNFDMYNSVSYDIKFGKVTYMIQVSGITTSKFDYTLYGLYDNEYSPYDKFLSAQPWVPYSNWTMNNGSISSFDFSWTAFEPTTSNIFA